MQEQRAIVLCLGWYAHVEVSGRIKTAFSTIQNSLLILVLVDPLTSHRGTVLNTSEMQIVASNNNKKAEIYGSASTK